MVFLRRDGPCYVDAEKESALPAPGLSLQSRQQDDAPVAQPEPATNEEEAALEMPAMQFGE